jgi:hypothetical protein
VTPKNNIADLVSHNCSADVRSYDQQSNNLPHDLLSHDHKKPDDLCK